MNHYWIVCIFLLLGFQSKADDRNSMVDSIVDGSKIWDDYFIFNPVLRYYIDTAHQYSDDEIINASNKNLFHKEEGYTLQIKNSGATYWSRFPMLPSPPDKPRVLEIMTPQTELIWVFFPVGKNEWRKYHTGSLLPWSKRAFHHKNFIFNIPVDLDSTRNIYIKVYSANQVHLLFKVRSVEDFSGYSLNEYLYLGIFYGILLFLIVYNLLFFINTRAWVYLFYCLSMVASAGNTLHNDGLGFGYLWPDHPEWTHPLGFYVFPLLFMTCYLLYAYFFFADLGKELVRYRKIILYTILTYFAYSLCRIFFFSSYAGFDWLYAFPFTIIYVVFVLAYFKGVTAARFFIIGNTFAVSAIIVDQLRLHNIIEASVFTVYSFNIGIVLDSVSLSLALVDRLSQLKKKEQQAKEREIVYLKEIGELQEKVTKELESKVSERTQELQDEKEKLQSLVHQLEHMSIELDKDNWKLKSSIKEEKKARMDAREISFEEFLQLYPTTAFCLDRLEEWKWGGTFVCKKCEHQRYALNEVTRSRKCSRCGNIESLTANTIFHGLKFPLHLAFYITYRVIQNENCKPDDLAQKTGISIITCRAFKKRVLQHKEELISSKKVKRVENWIQLVEESI